MNQEYEQQLEDSVSRELSALPLVKAPHTLQTRVLAALGSREALPERTPTPWPIPARAALFVGLSAVFVALYYGLPGTSLAQTTAEFGRFLTGLWREGFLVYGAFQTVLGALCLGLKNLGTPVLVGVGAAALLSYLSLLAIGTACYRLVFATGWRRVAERNL